MSARLSEYRRGPKKKAELPHIE